MVYHATYAGIPDANALRNIHLATRAAALTTLDFVLWPSLPVARLPFTWHNAYALDRRARSTPRRHYLALRSRTTCLVRTQTWHSSLPPLPNPLLNPGDARPITTYKPPPAPGRLGSHLEVAAVTVHISALAPFAKPHATCATRQHCATLPRISCKTLPCLVSVVQWLSGSDLVWRS